MSTDRAARASPCLTRFNLSKIEAELFTMLREVYPFSRMKLKDYDYVVQEAWPGAEDDHAQVLFLRESRWLQQQVREARKDMDDIKKRAAELAQVPAQEVVSANHEMEIAAANDTSDDLIPMIKMLAEKPAMSPETMENVEKIWDRARLDHEQSWHEAGQILPDDVRNLNSGAFTPEEVSLCNAIPLLALVRFVCILTPTSFSLHYFAGRDDSTQLRAQQ